MLFLLYIVYQRVLLVAKSFSIEQQQQRHQVPPQSHNVMSSSMSLLTLRTPDNVILEKKDPVDPTALVQARSIIDEIVDNDTGTVDVSALLKVAKRLGDVTEDAETVIIPHSVCREAFDDLSDVDRQTLLNCHGRVKAFAEAQRASVVDMEMDIPGGRAGHTVRPCQAAGCYAPGGRYPLPSSVLMTAVTARAAGCDTVVLASPRPARITMAAAHVCGVDFFLGVGGAQAVGSLAHGVPAVGLPPCDVIVGPGNKWVTAAKSLVNGRCGIDMLAGPSEVLVLADDTGNADVIAADMIAQAEHDVVARAILVTTDESIMHQVDRAVAKQLDTLPEPNQSTARAAFAQSFCVLCRDMDECIRVSDDIAPEHLEVQTRDAVQVGKRLRNYGGLFVGTRAAEVLGDYGAGPNHTLPTGGTGKYTGGLSVFNFLAIRTWMRIDDGPASQDMVNESVRLARLEGLEGHARAAEHRLL